MAEENGILAGSNGEDSQSHIKQIKVSMQQGEHTGQPIYSNFTSVQGLQGAVIVDFGFLDPQNVQALNRMVRSGDKASHTIHAKMSCRMVLSIDAANQLLRQLTPLLNKGKELQVQTEQQNMTGETKEEVSGGNSFSITENSATESGKSGFRFPWSRKTH